MNIITFATGSYTLTVISFHYILISFSYLKIGFLYLILDRTIWLTFKMKRKPYRKMTKIPFRSIPQVFLSITPTVDINFNFMLKMQNKIKFHKILI